MNRTLDPLLADGVIDEVVARLLGGKEADVWLVRHAGELVAAKVYKERDHRSFKNDAAYKEGRHVRNTRTQRAMDRGSRFGQAAAADAWKVKEADALYKLHAAGLRVPRPVLFYEGVLLMELVVDAHGRPAPRLVDAALQREQAAQLYADLRQAVIGMLAADLIHGDLSPYNVLMSGAGPVVIDFPQVIDAAHNSQAERFLLRDLENVHRFCVGLDPALRAAEGDGREIWRAYVRRELTADYVPTGRPPPERRSHQGERGRRDGGRGGAHGAHPPHAQGARRGGPQPAGASGHENGPAPRQGGAPGGSQPHVRAHPRAAGPSGLAGGQRRPDPGAAQPRGPGPRERRGPPQPEVIRVQRPPRSGPGPDGNAPGSRGGAGSGGRGHPGGRRRRRR
jgi:RIO kinase 1